MDVKDKIIAWFKRGKVSIPITEKLFSKWKSEGRDITDRLSKQFGKESFRDITKEWLRKSNPGVGTITEQQFVTVNGVRYNVDGKHVKLEITLDERENAQWLVNTFGGNVIHLPKVDNPPSIQTPDYHYEFIKDTLELKSINVKNLGKIEASLKRSQNQSENVLIHIKNKNSRLAEAIKYTNKLIIDNKTYGAKIIILRVNDEFIVIEL